MVSNTTPRSSASAIMLTQIAGLCSAQGVNIENMQSVSKKDYAYTILDITGTAGEALKKIAGVEGVKRVRAIH